MYSAGYSAPKILSKNKCRDISSAKLAHTAHPVGYYSPLQIIKDVLKFEPAGSAVAGPADYDGRLACFK